MSLSGVSNPFSRLPGKGQKRILEMQRLGQAACRISKPQNSPRPLGGGTNGGASWEARSQQHMEMCGFTDNYPDAGLTLN